MKAVVLFAGAFAVAFGLFSPQPGHAAWIRRHAFDCMTDVLSVNTPPWISDGQGIENQDNDNGLRVDCALGESSSFQKQDVNSLNVHGEDRNNSSSAAAQACVTYWWNNNGGECGTVALSGTSFLGPYTLTPSLSKWTATFATDFAYVYVFLPDEQGTNGPSTFRGYSVGTP